VPALTVLHLTDLHFGWDRDPTEAAERELALDGLISAASTLRDRWHPDMVCLTGDVGWRGSVSDYELARKWLERLLQRLNLGFGDVVTCPGNHDVDRSISGRIPRPANSRDADQCLRVPLSAIPTFSAFSAFSAFCKTAGIRLLRLNDEETFLVGETIHKGVRFIGCNSAWFCKADDDQKKLWIGLPLLKVLEANKAFPPLGEAPGIPTICLVHHPPDWWHDAEIHADGERLNTQDYLALRCHLILSGHTHGEVRRPDRIAQAAHHFAGGSAFAGASHFNSFRLIRIDESRLEYRSFEFDPQAADNKWFDRKGAQRLPFGDGPPDSIQVARAQTAHLEMLQAAACRFAQRTINAKSRQVRRCGLLPDTQQINVHATIVTESSEHKRATVPREQTVSLPLYEVCCGSVYRRTALFGDLGSGKSTLAAQLVTTIIDREPMTVPLMLPVRSLRLPEEFRADEFLTAAGAAFAGETGGAIRPDIGALLAHGTECFLILDGLDEIPRMRAARLLRQCETLTEAWTNLRILVTGRPVELAGIGYDSWCLCSAGSLSNDERERLFEAEAIASGTVDAKHEARKRLAALKRQAALQDIASTPLAVKLLYPKLVDETDSSLTIGDLLCDLLKEKLGVWAQRDNKASPYQRFEESHPTPEVRASLLGMLALAAQSKEHLSVEEAETILQGTGQFSQPVAKEALAFFEQAGLITGQPEICFAFQPLTDVAAGAAWLDHAEETQLAGHATRSPWRYISFAAAIARRRGMLDSMRARLESCLDQYLRTASGIPPACFIVSESQDRELARRAVVGFRRLGRKPLPGLSEDHFASYRAVAHAIALAGEIGFDWFHEEYLDAIYPIVHRASAIPEIILKHWAWFSRATITSKQRDRLRPLVAPLIRCGGLFDFLSTLVHIVPDAFTEEHRLWFLVGSLDDMIFGDLAEMVIRCAAGTNNKELLRAILIRRAVDVRRAICLYFALFAQDHHSPYVIQTLIRWNATDPLNKELKEAKRICLQQVSEEVWKRFLRWSLSDVSREGYHAGAAAVQLYELGERGLPIIGEGLLVASRNGLPNAEMHLSALVKVTGESGLRWLVSRMNRLRDFIGAHESWWRVLLDKLDPSSPIARNSSSTPSPRLDHSC